MKVIGVNSKTIKDKYDISEIIDTFYRVPLETSPETLIGEVSQVFVVQENIIVVDQGKSKSILSFDMNGNQQSIVDLDQKNGMPLKLQTIQTLKGEMEAQNTKVPTTMITKTTTTIAKN